MALSVYVLIVSLMFNILKSANAVFFGTTALAVTTIVIGFSVKSLDQATAKQCLMHAWPAESHDIHIEWCVDNGYQVN